jgi:hypothetical protein
MSKQQRMWAAIAGGVIALGIIASLIPPEPPEPPRTTTTTFMAPPPTTTIPTAPSTTVRSTVPPALNATGTWYNDIGDMFVVVHDGRMFEARGTITGVGPVVMRGSLTLSGTNFDVFFAPTGVLIYKGTGSMPNPSHINFQINDGRGNFASGQLHINHLPGQ